MKKYNNKSRKQNRKSNKLRRTKSYRNLFNRKIGGYMENIPVTIKTNVPETLQWNNPNQQAPEPQYQGGIYTGPQAYGPWGVIPVTPTTSNMIHNNLESASPPPGGNVQYPGTNHLGNNYSSYPGISWYNNTTDLNPGPFRIKGTSCNSNNVTQKGGNKKRRNIKRKLKKTNKKH